MKSQFISPEAAAALWGAAGHPQVALRPIEDPKLLWLNKRAAFADPALARLGGTFDDYASHLLQTCAKLIAGGDDPAAACTGCADRYGGAGIARNGGSGRAVVIGGYHVKGVGRTPLVSPTASEAHASGGAYLEECVREAIHAEVVAAEFPRGAVPVLAIIDTGIVQEWRFDGKVKRERKCLLVRPAFLRPAHFERALAYPMGNLHEAHADAARVRHAFDWLKDHRGEADAVSCFTHFANGWAEQLAFGFVHRMSHGGHSTSNICLDGALVDFGASTALPTWAKTRVMPGGHVFGHEFAALVDGIKPAMYYWARFADGALSSPDVQAQVIARAGEHYNDTILLEVLRLVGLTRAQARHVLDAYGHPRLLREVGVLIRHFQQDRLDVLAGTPEPVRKWDLHAFWEDAPPHHCRGLRQVLAQAMEESMVQSGDTARRRGKLMQRTRDSLFREDSKDVIYEAVDGVDADRSPGALHAFINSQVARARRSSAHDFDDAVPVGFAVSDIRSYAMFRETTGRLFFVEEGTQQAATHPVRLGRVCEDAHHMQMHVDVETFAAAGLPAASNVK